MAFFAQPSYTRSCTPRRDGSLSCFSTTSFPLCSLSQTPGWATPGLLTSCVSSQIAALLLSRRVQTLPLQLDSEGFEGKECDFRCPNTHIHCCTHSVCSAARGGCVCVCARICFCHMVQKSGESTGFSVEKNHGRVWMIFAKMFNFCTPVYSSVKQRVELMISMFLSSPDLLYFCYCP